MSERSKDTVEIKSSVVSGRSKQLLLFGVFIAAVLICVVFAIAYHSANTAKRSMEDEVMLRQKNLVASRVFALDNWLKDTVTQSRRLADSDLFRLFASEVDKSQGVPLLFAPQPTLEKDTDSEAIDDGDEPASRLPLMRAQLVEFTEYSGFLSGQIVTNKGEMYLTTDTTLPPLTAVQQAVVKEVVGSGRVGYGPVQKGINGFTMDFFIPIYPPQFEMNNRSPLAVVILSKIVDVSFREFLSFEGSAKKGRTLHLLQKNDQEFEDVVPFSFEIIAVAESSSASLQGMHLAFGLRKAMGKEHNVYSSGTRLSSLNWWLVAEDDASLIAGKFQATAKTYYSLAGLVSLVLVLLVSAVWWWLIGREQAAITNEFKELVVVIEDQKKLLDGINNTISDPISLTDQNGVFRYVNKAFATAVGRDEDDVLGLDVPAVFGFDTARRLNVADQHVLMTGESISIQDILWLQSKRYDFQISKAPLRDAITRTPQGIVSVFRDITQLVEAQEKSRRVVQQTINALVRAIEESDPFLGGHSRIMGAIALLITKQLRLSDFDTATIEAAANLSQIGKMFVPREILLKPGILTPEEKAQMEKHVEYARNILKDIEFDLPVVEAIYEINEHLDGKGYPRGLAGDEISIHSRVLAVANAFTAMARPRAYRSAIPVSDVLEILGKQSDTYDQKIVDALREVLSTPAGEKIVEQAASAKAL